MDLVFDHSKQIVNAFKQVMTALNILTHHIQFELAEYAIWAETPECTFISNYSKVISDIRKHEIDVAIPPQETFTFIIFIKIKTVVQINKLNVRG